MELVPSHHVICPCGLLSKTGGEKEEEEANYPILMCQSASRVKAKDKYTDLSSQPFDTIDSCSCTAMSVVPQLVD